MGERGLPAVSRSCLGSLPALLSPPPRIDLEDFRGASSLGDMQDRREFMLMCQKHVPNAAGALEPPPGSAPQEEGPKEMFVPNCSSLPRPRRSLYACAGSALQLIRGRQS